MCGLDRSSHDFRVDVVGKDVVEAGFDGERLVQELLVEMFLHIVYENGSNPTLVILGTA